jgi:hypothetical protein
LNRETDVQKHYEGGWNWMPPADYLSLASMLTTVFGVFVLPIAGLVSQQAAQSLFGLSVILFAGYQVALLAHYKLLLRGAVKLPGRFCTWDEALAIAATLGVAALYLAATLGRIALPGVGPAP